VFELGNSLREARIRQGLEFSEIELATKIRGKYIRALEEEDFSTLPGNTYVRGFLRAYADHLGLDGDLYVDEYSSRFASEYRDELAESLSRSRPRTSRQQRTVERRGLALALVGIAVLTVLVFVAWRFGGIDTSTPPVLGTTARNPAATALPGLVLRGVGKGTYVEVRRDSPSGKVVLEATVPSGGVEQLSGRRFYLRIRRSAGLRVKLGGRPVALPARKNLRVVVTPDRTILLSG
jgi:hypothetical protein